ncbi:hypothetical protein OG992_33120 [Micromonospora sp. NBC_00362]|uniref:hypothetical protein n=1 Tax=Micromonospora sp. NBC_00362 TaxID=2975975 RepID=UPI00224D506E|nr:hypothetical protein [Micromonospora sp. NBC_00362]MCX5122007.1 hypothetical protein [Micromonospora sp. NBC_00362]
MGDAFDSTDQDADGRVEQVVAHVRATLGEPSGWVEPAGYPQGLALCVIDSIQSIGVTYGSVVKVVNRYTALRRSQGCDPAVDGTPELLSTFASLGGVEAWAQSVGSANRTSTHAGAPLKALAIEQAATALSASEIFTCRDLRDAGADQLRQAEQAWRGVPGQRSGTSWRYLLMLSGTPGVKPDRMILRFVAAALNSAKSGVNTDLAATLVTEAAQQLGVTPTKLDHAMWRWQSGRAS